MKFKNIFAVIFLLAIVRCGSATVRTIQVADFNFTPQSLSATVGDTISWVWSSGGHTTTSVGVPGGAATWDSPIDNTHNSFNYVITVAGTYNYQCSIHASMGMNGSFTASPIGIKSVSLNVPEKFTLYQNYPNPFNPSTNIRFDIPSKTIVRLRIYDITGRFVAELANESVQPGTYSADWDASNYASGVYFYKLETSDFVITKKLALIK